MMGRNRRIRRSFRKRSTEENAASDNPGYGTNSLLGGKQVTLDDDSLVIPPEDVVHESGYFSDDISSLNSSVNHLASISTFPRKEQKFASNVPASRRQKEAPLTPQTQKIKEGDAEISSHSPGSSSSTISSTASEQKSAFIPLWIRQTPHWLKMVMLVSAVLMFLAIILAAVGISLSVAKSSTSATTSDLGNGATPVPAPPVSVATTSAPTRAPTGAPTGTPALRTQVPDINSKPTNRPSASPLSPPPSVYPDSNIVTFYLTAGNYTNETLTAAQEGLPRIPTGDGNSFLVNLGDWNDLDTTDCEAQAYTDVAQLYSLSSVPTYFVVGDNEFTDCSDPKSALDLWDRNLIGFEDNFWDAPAWEVTQSDKSYPENFAFDHNGIVFCSITLVGGFQADSDVQNRNSYNLQWIDDNFWSRSSRMKMFVLLANNVPPGAPFNQEFYATLIGRIQSDYSQIPFVIACRDSGDFSDFELLSDLFGVSNLSIISLSGPLWPPLQVQIDLTQLEPITLDAENWWNALN